MIDIIEAGKFYNDCLEKVKEATLKENVLPENTVIGARADIMQYGERMCKTVVGAFELNNVDYTFKVDLDRSDQPHDILRKTTSAIANVVAEAMIHKIDWDEVK